MRGSVKCPTCRVEVAWEGNPFRPFCSDRCRTVDLGAWASERYRIPAEEEDVPSEEQTPTADVYNGKLDTDDP